MAASTDNPTLDHSNRVATMAAAGGLVATIATAAACVGPLIAILLGVSGFGWLVQYAYLRVRASIATAAMLGFGFYWVYRPKCAKKKSSAAAKAILWTATVLATLVNLFEYVIFPRLG